MTKKQPIGPRRPPATSRANPNVERTTRAGKSTLERVLKTALRLFSEHDYATVTMRKLAKEADINQATLYHYFISKEILYTTVLRWAYSDRAAAQIETINSSGTPAERLHRTCVAFCRDLDSDKPFTKLIKREQLQGNRERLQLLLELLFTPWLEALEGLFAEFGSGLNSQLLTSFFTGMTLHYYETETFRSLFDQQNANRGPDYVAEQIYRVLTGGLLGTSAVPVSSARG